MAGEETPARPRAQRVLLTLALAPTAVLVAFASSAGAAVPASLHDPASCERIVPAPGHAVWRCDDGVPDAGGTEPNESGARAVTVPARYRGYARLPRRAANAQATPGADSRGYIALDVNVTLPTMRAPRRGFPLLFMMHGCCGGSKTSSESDSFDAEREAWHYSNAWFAARGYAVVTYTSRGFVNAENNGSTGEMHLQSRRYEINDYQHLACQITRNAPRFRDVTGKRVRVDPQRVAVTSGSYGGGFSWMVLTDPKWSCTADTGTARTRMSLAAVAPKYGWTDLPYSLVPTGRHFLSPKRLPARSGCDSGPKRYGGKDCDPRRTPVGIPKASILAGLYATGKTGVPPGAAPHTTFPPEVDEAVACLDGPYPPESNPLCADTIEHLLPELLRDNSAYYQHRFFRRIARRAGWRVPVFAATPFTDPLFPGSEHWRMVNRLQRVVPRYPVQTYAGDFQHFAQNKAKEWGDLCEVEGERRVCTTADYDRGLNRPPSTLVRKGTTTRLNDFLDYYVRPQRAKRVQRPRRNVTAAVQVCPQNAPLLGVPADEPGPTFTAPSYRKLAPNTLRVHLTGTRTTTAKALPNLHALAADPVADERLNGPGCIEAEGPAGPGVATYESVPLARRQTVIGGTIATVRFQPPPVREGLQLNARLYDVFPDGTAVLMDRGPRRVTAAEAAAGWVLFQLHGNAWRLPRGHRIRIELAQDDMPYLRSSDVPSSMTLTGVTLRIPVRERPAGG